MEQRKRNRFQFIFKIYAMITNRPKALQKKFQDMQLCDRVGFLKVETGEWPAIVFNELDWESVQGEVHDFEKGIDIFPIIVDVVVKYEDYLQGYEIRNTIRKEIWKFNGSLTEDREGTIAFRSFLSPDYNPKTNEIVFWAIYLLKSNYDYSTD